MATAAYTSTGLASSVAAEHYAGGSSPSSSGTSAPAHNPYLTLPASDFTGVGVGKAGKLVKYGAIQGTFPDAGAKLGVDFAVIPDVDGNNWTMAVSGYDYAQIFNFSGDGRGTELPRQAYEAVADAISAANHWPPPAHNSDASIAVDQNDAHWFSLWHDGIDLVWPWTDPDSAPVSPLAVSASTVPTVGANSNPTGPEIRFVLFQLPKTDSWDGLVFGVCHRWARVGYIWGPVHGLQTGSELSAVLSGAGTGAGIGSLIVPGVGTIIGGIVGSIGGLFVGLYQTDQARDAAIAAIAAKEGATAAGGGNTPVTPGGSISGGSNSSGSPSAFGSTGLLILAGALVAFALLGGSE